MLRCSFLSDALTQVPSGCRGHSHRTALGLMGRAPALVHSEKKPLRKTMVVAGHCVGDHDLQSQNSNSSALSIYVDAKGRSEFPGHNAQGTGQVGLETGSASDLWLQNRADVIHIEQARVPA
jgi:hypothetical protein